MLLTYDLFCLKHKCLFMDNNFLVLWGNAKRGRMVIYLVIALVVFFVGFLYFFESDDLVSG